MFRTLASLGIPVGIVLYVTLGTSLHPGIKTGVSILVLLVGVIVWAVGSEDPQGSTQEKEKEEMDPDKARTMVEGVTQALDQIMADVKSKLVENDPENFKQSTGLGMQIKMLCDEGHHHSDYVKENMAEYLKVGAFAEEHFDVPDLDLENSMEGHLYGLTDPLVQVCKLGVMFPTDHSLDYVAGVIRKNLRPDNRLWPEILSDKIFGAGEDLKTGVKLREKVGDHIPEDFICAGYLDMTNLLCLGGAMPSEQHPYRSDAGYKRLHEWLSGDQPSFAKSAACAIIHVPEDEKAEALCSLGESYQDIGVFCQTMWARVVRGLKPEAGLGTFLKILHDNESEEAQQYALGYILDDHFCAKLKEYQHAEDETLSKMAGAALVINQSVSAQLANA